jgi:hypothetical protein
MARVLRIAGAGGGAGGRARPRTARGLRGDVLGAGASSRACGASSSSCARPRSSRPGGPATMRPRARLPGGLGCASAQLSGARGPRAPAASGDAGMPPRRVCDFCVRRRRSSRWRSTAATSAADPHPCVPPAPVLEEGLRRRASRMLTLPGVATTSAPRFPSGRRFQRSVPAAPDAAPIRWMAPARRGIEVSARHGQTDSRTGGRTAPTTASSRSTSAARATGVRSAARHLRSAHGSGEALIKTERVTAWRALGAQLSPSVKSLMRARRREPAMGALDGDEGSAVDLVEYIVKGIVGSRGRQVCTSSERQAARAEDVGGGPRPGDRSPGRMAEAMRAVLGARAMERASASTSSLGRAPRRRPRACSRGGSRGAHGQLRIRCAEGEPRACSDRAAWPGARGEAARRTGGRARPGRRGGSAWISRASRIAGRQCCAAPRSGSSRQLGRCRR